MNKARHHEIKMLKLKKRLANYGLTNAIGNFYAFRSHGKPCSCYICSPTKWQPKEMKHSDKIKLTRITPEEIEAIRCKAYKLLLP